MKKLTRKALITIITIAVVFVVLGTATFAWITINQMASVRGMRMEVDTTNSLQIEEETEIVEANFTNTVVNPGRNQIKYLQPVSSTDGLKFFYTQYLITGVDGNGQLNDNAKLEEYDEEDFGLLYDGIYDEIPAGRKVQGYAEYTFILKAYASTDAVKVYLTDVEFTNQDNAETEHNAFRMAVLTKHLTNYESGLFATVDYESLGVVSSKEAISSTENAARSIKNNQEYLAFGKKTPGEVTTNYATDPASTIQMYKTNYGKVLFSDDDGTTYYEDAKKAKPYELVLATADDVRYVFESTSLQSAEKVIGISQKQNHGKWEFKSNLDTTLYGDDPESVRVTTWYEWNATTQEFDEYTMNPTREVIDTTVDAKPVKALNGITYYELTTKLEGETDPYRKVYCLASNGNAPLFTGTKTAETAEEKDTCYDVVKDFNPATPIMTLAQGKTGYVLVTLRIWVEGEDQDCTNSKFITLGKSYNMNVKFGLEAPTELYLN